MPPPRGSSARRLQELFRMAQGLHQAGRLADAGTIYREILRQNPRHADALATQLKFLRFAESCGSMPPTRIS